MSKELAEYLEMPAYILAMTAVMFALSGKPEIQWFDIVGVFVCIAPAAVLRWQLYWDDFEIPYVTKVRKAHRTLLLPFSTWRLWSTFLILSISVDIAVAMLLGYRNVEDGLPLLFISLILLTGLSIAVDHPKVWFSDTINAEDSKEEFDNTPKEHYAAYQDGDFTFSSDSFSIVIDDESSTVRWEEIEEIITYKVDLMTYDEIRISVKSKSCSFIITDETVGFMKFMDQAGEHLPDFDLEWYRKVVLPPFEECLTIVFQREKSERSHYLRVWPI